MPNPDTLHERHSYITNVGNSRHTSETNVIQPNTGIPTVPPIADTSLGKGHNVLFELILLLHISRLLMYIISTI